ncbi:MAG: biotin--[acetyl-CoA-carboxylase] ligase [Melioribacteraceae bacterium]|nr:biotin--[acetyl-CoA-carboxylase] ligase [Melioribacteraceae bacterium]
MFNIEEFDIKLDTEIIGRNFIYFEEVNSTNSYLLETEVNTDPGTVVLSEYQLQGRGRKQRDWTAAKEQALTFSILINNLVNIKNVQLLTLGTSVAVVQAFENLYQLDVNVKWPNDVLVEDKKIAGILVESITKGNKLEKVVVGIGINVNQPNFSGKFNIRPTSVRMELKKQVSRERLLSEVLNLFEEMLQNLKNNKQKVLNDWKSRSRLIGEKIRIVEGDAEKYGIFEDIDNNGFLMLKTREGVETILTGDVSIR